MFVILGPLGVYRGVYHNRAFIWCRSTTYDNTYVSYINGIHKHDNIRLVVCQFVMGHVAPTVGDALL